MLRRFLIGLVIVALLGGATLTYWIASPPESDRSLPAPLEPWIPHTEMPSSYDTDLASLTRAFRPQAFRSFCGPSSMATVLRAYGKDADQKTVVPSIPARLKVFYSGMSLAELGSLAQDNGLRARVVYADSIDVDQFRELLKTNLGHAGDFVVINYDRKVLKQSGSGHISPIGAYDSSRDAFLVLDEAGYRYPFTWVPAPLLYAAARTRADEHFRGLLLVEGLASE
ncbi:MAG TPA: phytochelatin synthase family protein [Steroidobacteraceae bacterium]|jgi:hypothetical protein|nr:phytochelatin synthase family protein [Steroidobacteraceae bacterium]